MKFLLALCCMLPLTGPAREDPPAAAPRQERLDAWPKPNDAGLILREVERLKKAGTELMASSAAELLQGLGPQAAPALLDVLAKEKNEEARQRAEAVLREITGAEHTRLLAKHFAGKSHDLRCFCLERVALFPDPAVRDAAESALASARKLRERNDEEKALRKRELDAASLCCASAGSLAGFDEVAALTIDAWGKRGAEIRAALLGLRGTEAATRAILMLAGDRPSVVTGLRILAVCGDKSQAAVLRPHLDSSDNSIRVEAINACRGMIAGEPPLLTLSAFDAIELAKKWKERL